MNAPIRKLDLEEFALLVSNYPWQRDITSVHLHHTWRPNHAQWRGQATVEAMRRVHMQERGFRDIAQHLTIDPSGGLWSGRDWNWPPASSRGRDPKGAPWNGDSHQGPFMIEMVGDFDRGKDVLVDPQREAVVEVLALLLARAPKGAVKLLAHMNMDSHKSCPGTSLVEPVQQGVNGFDQLLLDAHGRAEALRGSLAPPIPSDRQPPALRRLLSDLASARSASPGALADEVEMHHEVPEDQATVVQIQRNASAFSGLGEGSRGAIESKYRPLNGRVLNTAHGRLSEHSGPRRGLFFTSQEELDGPFFDPLDAFEKQLDRDAPLRVMIHAHGGLVSERTALNYALEHAPWWERGLQVFPYYMVWETGGFETLLGRKRALEFGERSLGDWLVEKTLGGLGFKLWRQMKANAELASSAEWARDYRRLLGKSPNVPSPEGLQGGGRQFAAALALRLARFAERREVQIHALGHSAGAIHQAHFLPTLVSELRKHAPWKQGPAIHSLHLLAPAIRLDAFEQHLARLAGADIARMYMYTMDDRRERDDTVALIYRKSLLYFVDEACENGNPGILGMQKYLDAARAAGGAIARAFPLAAATPGEVIYSDGGRDEQRSRSSTHGGFDNDPATMESVARTILGNGTGPAPLLPSQRYRLWCGEDASTDPLGAVFADDEETPLSNERFEPNIGTGHANPEHGRHALCIGIDSYQGSAALHGCVNDARAWSAGLSKLGFAVHRLEDEQASLANLKRAIRDLLGRAADGDWLVLQFAGHGTQFENMDGEEDFDQAYVPQDFRQGGFLIDNELNALLLPHAQRLKISVFFDTCHSGTASRLAPLNLGEENEDRRPRYLPADEQMQQKYREQVQSRARSFSINKAKPDQKIPWLHLAACQDHEYAFETNGSGDFSRAAVPLLERAAREGWRGHQLLAEIMRSFPASARQTPNLMSSTVAGRQILPAPPAAGAAHADRVGSSLNVGCSKPDHQSMKAALSAIEEGVRALRHSLNSDV